jgi:hypothetical protein
MNRAARIIEAVLAEAPGAVVESREPNAVLFDLGNGQKRLVVSGELLHRPDGSEIDAAWVDSPTAADVELTGESLKAYAMLSLTVTRLMCVVNGSGWLEYRPLPLAYAHSLTDLADLATLQIAARPQAVTATPDDDLLRWADAYGSGIHLELRATPTGVEKWLEIAALNSLPNPNTLIRSGSGQTLEIPFAVTLAADLRARIASGELSLDRSETNERVVALVDAAGTPVLALQRPVAVDAAGNEVQGRLRFRRTASGLQVSSSIPLDWLRTAAYPVRIDPTVTQSLTVSSNDYHSSAEGTFTSTFGQVTTGTTASGNSDLQGAFRWAGLNIPKGAVISSATMDVYFNEAPSSPLTMQLFLEAGINPAASTTASEMRARALTTAVVEWSLTTQSGQQVTPNLKTIVQEQVSKADMTAFIVRTRNKNRTNTSTAQHVRIVSSDNASAATIGPKLSVTYSDPQTAQATLVMPTPGLIAEGEIGSGAVTGEATLVTPTPGLIAEGYIGTPPPVIGQATLVMPTPGLIALGGEMDPKLNTLFTVERYRRESHHLATEAGELLAFNANFDATLGGIREGMLGTDDAAWFPESALRNRVPGALQFRADLNESLQPRLETDRLKRLLPDVRELHLPDGGIIDVSDGDYRARPTPATLEVLLRPKGAHPRHPLLSGTIQAAFETEDSTPEVPIYAIDAAGGITAPLTMKRISRGALCFGVRLAERGINALASIGTPINGDGTADPTSVVLSYQDTRFHTHLRGAQFSVREVELATFGAVLVCHLVFTEFSAYLVTVTGNGRRVYDLPIGAAVDLSERILTAGVRSDGVGNGGFMALGSSSLGAPFLSLRVPTQAEAEEGAQALYDELATPEKTWVVKTPEMSLEVNRADTKALELAPGESLTFDLAVKRIGGYTGTLDVTTTAQEGITASAALLSASGDTDTYRITLSAPASTAEGAYTFRFEAKATGADNPGSLLVDVRDNFDALVEVAASPAIMDNSTVFLQANDPVQYRAAEFLRDFSAYANTFSWRSYARPNRAGNGILCTGYVQAAVFSGALINTASPQRFNGLQSYCNIFAEVSKTPVGGVMMQIAADAGDDHILLRRVQGGFSLRHTIGGVTVTSPDVLPYESGYAELGLRVTLTEIILTDRATMRSIRMPRPALPDAGARVTFGAVRTAAGGYTDVTRTHLMAATIHPYDLSDIQFRRNMDKLHDYAPAPDGLPEYANSALIIAEFNDNTAEQPDEKLKNRAAPAFGITLVNKGGVAYIAGGVNPDGDVSRIITTEFESLLPTSIALEAVAVIQDINYGTDYDTQFGVSDSGKTNGYTTVSRRYDAVARVRTLNDGGTFVSKDLPKTPKTGKAVFCLKVTESGKRVDATELVGGETVTLIRDAGWTGN